MLLTIIIALLLNTSAIHAMEEEKSLVEVSQDKGKAKTDEVPFTDQFKLAGKVYKKKALEFAQAEYIKNEAVSALENATLEAQRAKESAAKVQEECAQDAQDEQKRTRAQEAEAEAKRREESIASKNEDAQRAIKEFQAAQESFDGARRELQSILRLVRLAKTSPEIATQKLIELRAVKDNHTTETAPDKQQLQASLALLDKGTILDLQDRIRLYDANPASTYACLSIDAEGTQALIAAVMLKEIELRTGRRIHELFDYITGSSFGGILALGLVASRDGCSSLLKTEQLVELFSQKSKEFFSPAKRTKREPYYPLDVFQSVLRCYFKNVFLSNALARVLVPCMYESSKKTVIFDRDEAQRNEENDFMMHLIAAAAGADPIYFPAVPVSNVTKGNEERFIADTNYKNNAAGILRDRIFDKVPRQSLVLSITGGMGNEETHMMLRKRFGLQYCRLQPIADLLPMANASGNPDDISSDILDRYVAYAQRTLEGSEAFIRALAENKISKQPLSA